MRLWFPIREGGVATAIALLFFFVGSAFSAEIGQRAPDFSLRDVVAKKQVRLSDLTAKGAVLLYVWNEVCPLCDDIEGKAFDRVVAEKREKVVGMVIVENGDELEMEMAATIYRPASLLLLASGKKISTLYGITRLPSLIGIDREGMIRFRGTYQGPDALRYLIDQLGVRQ